MHIALALQAVAAFSTSILQYTEIHNITTLEYTKTQLHSIDPVINIFTQYPIAQVTNVHRAD